MTLDWNKSLLAVGIGLVLLATAWNYWPREESVPSTLDRSNPAPEVVVVPPEEDEQNGQSFASQEAVFDVIRLSPEGLGVFAGQGPKGSEIVIKNNGKLLGRVEVDERGEWVWVASEALPSGSHTLSLEVWQDGTILPSSTVAVVVVPDVENKEEGQGSFALVIPEVEQGALQATKLLQQPRFKAGVADEGKALGVDTIDYNDDGQVMISGRATEGSTVLIYLDGEKIGEVAMQPQERYWRFQPKGRLAEGRYRLRVEQLLDGKVAKKIELPFQHSRYISADKQQEGVQSVVVQPGNSLWRIARKTLGKGTRYVIIYEANRDQIEDQNLIYPGQVFVIPPSPESSELTKK